MVVKFRKGEGKYGGLAPSIFGGPINSVARSPYHLLLRDLPHCTPSSQQMLNRPLAPPSVKTGFVKATCNEIFAHQALNERKGGAELHYGGGQRLKN